MFERVKCLLFGHPPTFALHDGDLFFKPTSALGYFELTYCARCKELYFRYYPEGTLKRSGHKDAPIKGAK
jgi:hypothetical protein